MELGLLKALGVVAPSALFPVVGLLEHKPKNAKEVHQLFSRCNVVVTTMAIAGQCTPEVQKAMATICSPEGSPHIFRDFRQFFGPGNFCARPHV
jgi:hypothetical protein